MKKLLLLIAVLAGVGLWATPKANAGVYIGLPLPAPVLFGGPYYDYAPYGYGYPYGYYGGGYYGGYRHYGYYGRGYRGGYYGGRGGYYHGRGFASRGYHGGGAHYAGRSGGGGHGRR